MKLKCLLGLHKWEEAKGTKKAGRLPEYFCKYCVKIGRINNVKRRDLK